MKHMSRFLAASLVLLCSAPSRAQDLSISEAMKFALEHSPTLNSVRQEVRKAKGSKVQADGNFYPRISINGSYSDGRYPSVGNNGWRTDSRSASVGLSQNLYAGGKHAAQRRLAKEQLSQAELTVREAEEDLAVRLNTLFYSVLLARETVAAAKDAVETSQKHVQEVRHLMGLPPSSEYSPVGTLKSSRPAGTPPASIELARKQRADKAILEKQIAMQKEQIKIAQSGMKPSVDFSASAAVDNPYHNQDRTDDSWKATLSLEIPVYDRGQTRGEVMKARAVQEQNKYKLRQKELDILSEIDLAWVEINDSEAHVTARRKAHALAKETLRLSQVGYREGVTPQLDLLEAQSNLTSARKDYSQSLFNHLMRIVALKRAEGALIPWTLEGR